MISIFDILILFYIIFVNSVVLYWLWRSIRIIDSFNKYVEELKEMEK